MFYDFDRRQSPYVSDNLTYQDVGVASKRTVTDVWNQLAAGLQAILVNNLAQHLLIDDHEMFSINSTV